MSISRHPVVVAGLLVLAPAAAGALDLTGKWRFESGSYVELVQVTQSGSALSFSLAGYAFSGSLGSPGTFTSYEVDATSPNRANVFGRVMPSGNLLDGRVVVAFSGDPPYGVGGVVATRCTCDDGNTTNGDGCDATCQVEACWTCAGDPSICSPAGDGSACEDGSDCTTGETCTAGACGGGAPVSPCTDMTGRWNRHAEISGGAPGPSSVDFASQVTQRGTDLVFRNPASGNAGDVGTIDPVTGNFDVRAVNSDLFCSPFDPLTGSVAPNGLTYAATGTVDFPLPATPDHCGTYPLTENATRCGTGTIDLRETCDDGNLDDGDGCSATCGVEPCWTCSGEPSACTPLTGTPCDDSDPCTSGDTCTSAGACVGGPIVCAPCLACGAGGACVAAPRSPCKASARPEKSVLAFKNVADAEKDKLAWTWKRGAPTMLGELGDPPGGDGYVLCLYDETGVVPALLFRATVPGGGTCDGGPCWTPKSDRGFGYKNKAGAPDGVVSTRLRSGDPASAVVKGSGPLLSSHAYGLPSVPLSTPFRVQLQGDAGFCAETRYDASGVLKNDPAHGTFKARGVP